MKLSLALRNSLAAKRAELALEVYRAAYGNTDTFDEVGAFVAYLMGAILQPKPTRVYVACDRENGEVQLVYILRVEFSDPSHPVWKHVEIVDDGTEITGKVKACLIRGKHMTGAPLRSECDKDGRCKFCGSQLGADWMDELDHLFMAPAVRRGAP